MDEVRERLQAFANRHKLILEDRGEVGFGRSCVGFVKGNVYVDYNPYSHPSFEPVWERDHQLNPPDETPDAYHKHDCLVVLVRGGDYDGALRQLDAWITHLEGQGEVYIDEYETGATGLQAMISGLVGYAVRIRDKAGESS
ncbi:MAG: hypothetical protein ACYSVY_00290 [Planctomycetota bacterium]|jgi:hypothetical protein